MTEIPYIEPMDEDDGLQDHQYARISRRQRRLEMLLQLSIGVACFLCVLIVVGAAIGWDMILVSRPPQAVYSPARAVGNYRPIHFDGALNATNPFKGPPGNELDDTWRRLHSVKPFAVTTQELEKINKTSLEVPTRPAGHFVSLAVFHQLHCLDKVRRYLHKDYYHMEDHDSTVSLIDHMDHCIDMLRQALMCQADTTLITWEGSFTNPKPDFSATHYCRSFDTIHDWAKEREIDVIGELSRDPEALADVVNKEIEQTREPLD
ncbi:hypothetical protein FQN53_008254 [Emmonsiellopsis sp. PD_33]|nr:hypothetical protein FQN53_008254 [Emmonsiellopsis sp. PD_33]